MADEAGKPKDAQRAKVEAAVEEWVDSHLRNSSFSQDTAAWNHFNAGRDALIDGITRGIKA